MKFVASFPDCVLNKNTLAIFVLESVIGSSEAVKGVNRLSSISRIRIDVLENTSY